ncbi:MAG TPA: HAMP domain-containing protein [Desulfuromonadales bacterium]|nr:HAMP domain-containing protein [Desulfuromonadales bacterium]
MKSVLKRLKLRGKLLTLVLPLVIIPVCIVAAVIGFIANEQAYRGVTSTSKDDLLHLSSFTIDLLDSHHQQTREYSSQTTAADKDRSELKKAPLIDTPFEQHSFNRLKERIRGKKVGDSGYIFCMDSSGTLTVHPDSEGKNVINSQDLNGNSFIREMCRTKSGWIRYPWKNSGDSTARMKIVRYDYFEPWDWIVAVGSYEDEFYQEAHKIKTHILISMALLLLLVGVVATLLVYWASTVFTRPISHMVSVIQSVRRGNLDQRMTVSGEDELADMSSAFNHMADIIQRNKTMESTLAQQEKMASLGLLSSGVAHEINNPLGVILGYAGYLEGKLSPDDPNYQYIHEIKRESKRCKKIVQDLLSYARTPRPLLAATDLNHLLEQIVDFSANHTDMRGITITTSFAGDLPPIEVDGDLLRQVAINLILNAGGAMPEGGRLAISTEAVDTRHVRITFRDSGCGIPSESLDKIFEPFYSTKAHGTGLGLAITRQIIEQHYGEIRIESCVGSGTSVIVTLPTEREEI